MSFLGVMFLLTGFARGQSMLAALKLLDSPRYQTEIYLDYQAEKERVDAISSNMNHLVSGMPFEVVDSLIGAPDEILPVFDPGMRGEAIKWVRFVYLFSREKVDEWGKSTKDQSIELIFNLSNQLVAAVGNGVVGFEEIVREQGLGFRFELALHEKVKIEELLLQLDFVIESGKASEGGNSESNESGDAKALLTIQLVDREGTIELQEVPEKRSIMYRNYKITLLGIRNTETILLLVE